MIKTFTKNKANFILNLFLIYALLSISAIWNNSVSANETRIIAIDASLSEIVFALGHGKNMVGRDITSAYPAAVAQLPSVGYMRSLSAEGILSLRPDLVLATSDARPQSVLLKLKEAGIKVEIIKNEFSVAGVKYKIRRVATVLNEVEKGEQIVIDMQKSVDNAVAIAHKAKEAHGDVSALFILNMRGHNMMVAGNNNRANNMMELALIYNSAAKDFTGFKPLTSEAAIKYNPQFLLIMPFGLSSAGGRDAILSTPAIKMTEAGRKQQLVVLNDGFLTFGPRIGQAIEDLVNKVYLPKNKN